MTTKDGRRRPALIRAWKHGGAALLILGLPARPAPAQAPATAPAVASALAHMKASGAPLVVVVTASARPESRAFGRSLIDGPWARSNRGLVQVIELPAEGNAATIERLRVTSYPSVLVYTAGPEGPECRGIKAGGSVEEAVAWLASLGIGDPPASGAVTFDPAVMPAMHDGYASPQQSYAPPTSAAPPAPSTPAQGYAPAPPSAMLSIPVATPAQAPASFVQLPGPNVVVQQGEARVFVAPPAGASMAPPPASANLYLPVAASPAPAPAAPAFALAATPVAAMAPVAVAAPTMAVATAPVAAITNQTIGVPTAGTRTRVRVKGPGPIRSSLASLGEKMVQLGRSRIETVQETELNTPAVQGGGNIATFTSTSATPLPPQIANPFTPPASSPPPVCQAPPPQVTPTPQGAHKHGLFHKDDD